LDTKLEGRDEPEDLVVEKCLKHVDLVLVDDSAVDLVEKIHQDEGVEQDRVKSQSVSCFSGRNVSGWCVDQVEGLFEEHELAEVHEDYHDQDLPHRVDEDLSPNFGQHDPILLADSLGLSLQVVGLRAQGDGAEDVHDQVCPEQLDDVERRLSEGQAA